MREERTPFGGSVAFFPERYGNGIIKLALDILARRFASGEISAEDYQKARDLLRADQYKK